MDFIFLKDYGPFKKGQITKLPPLTSVKLINKKIIEPYIEKVEIFVPITALKNIKPKRKRKKQIGG